MTSKAERRRRKKARALDGMELAEIPKRQPNGQTRQRADSPGDPRKTALDARCRMFGVPATRSNREALSGQHSGSQLGMVMQALCRPVEIPRLWSAWQGFCAAERTYRLRILGMSASAKGANIAMVPERMETDQGHTIDTRDSDTRDRDAVNAYMAWRGYLGHLPAAQQHLIHRAEKGDGKALWEDGPTPAGRVTLDALKTLADAAERRR